MKEQQRRGLVRQIMTDFAGQTGLEPRSRTPRRYLWTDAFAVCNFLTLYRQSGDESYKSLALSLVDQVHATLGRHRPDDSRVGWLSGLSEEEGRLHPTAGGLRIGKKLSERGPAEPFDEELEWNRDGQYYHYLTKWMHALQCVATVTSDRRYNLWAKELAKKVHASFVTTSPLNGHPFIPWKMSIDLSRPLVSAMGHHDPLDGLLAYRQLQLGSSQEQPESAELDLSGEIKELASMCQEKNWTTDDPLGIGGLLANALQLARLMVKERGEDEALLLAILDAALLGLDNFVGMDSLQLGADYRLAFREFGLAIGLQALAPLQSLVEREADSFRQSAALQTRITNLLRYQVVAGDIEKFWHKAASRHTDIWRAHADINMVMQATSLAPDGFLLSGSECQNGATGRALHGRRGCRRL